MSIREMLERGVLESWCRVDAKRCPSGTSCELDCARYAKKELTLDCMTCKSWPEVCQKCYERRK